MKEIQEVPDLKSSEKTMALELIVFNYRYFIAKILVPSLLIAFS